MSVFKRFPGFMSKNLIQALC